jgi:hypothetical protein
MVAVIKRMTTEFIEAEDRLRLSGEIENAEPAVMWLTQRLVSRLLPPLLQWLDRQTGAPLRREMIHGFAQEAALAELKPQAPVQAPTAEEAWRVEAIDVIPAEDGIGLVFRTGGARAASLGLTAQELRQWLAILYAIWLRAEWPTTVWPEWIKGEAKPTGQQIVLH